MATEKKRIGNNHKMTANSTMMANGSAGHGDVLDDMPSIIELKKVIPPHCFKPELKRSFYYVGKDLAICFALYVGLLLMENQPSILLRCAYTIAYWFFQGTIMWSVFVLGHDCGHGSFSVYPLLNDVVGTVLHSTILVPFYQWKLSHKWHHKNTGNIDKEEIFYPVREKDKEHDFVPKPYFLFGLAWFVYLFSGYSPRRVCHISVSEPLFQNHIVGCTCSLGLVVVWIGFLTKYAMSFGIFNLLVHYLAPVLVFASWLVIVTFLHHNEVDIPWFSNKTWGNVRGQISTLDRHYGWAHGLTHNIGTHQVHHLFTKVPHYHLEEATVHFRKAFPQLVRECNQPILSSFFRMFHVFKDQRHIGNDVDIHVYKTQ